MGQEVTNVRRRKASVREGRRLSARPRVPDFHFSIWILSRVSRGPSLATKARTLWLAYCDEQQRCRRPTLELGDFLSLLVAIPGVTGTVVRGAMVIHGLALRDYKAERSH